MFTTFTLKYSKDEAIKDKLLNLIFKSSDINSCKINILFTNLINWRYTANRLKYVSRTSQNIRKI